MGGSTALRKGRQDVPPPWRPLLNSPDAHGAYGHAQYAKRQRLAAAVCVSNMPVQHGSQRAGCHGQAKDEPVPRVVRIGAEEDGRQRLVQLAVGVKVLQ